MQLEVKIEDNKKNFLYDQEKMLDFILLSKEDFLESYSYLTEDEYEDTKNILLELSRTANNQMDTYSVKSEVEGANRTFEITLYGYDYKLLKDTLLQEVRRKCGLEKLSGEISINAVFTKNGEYLDSDECEAMVSDDYQTIEIIAL